MEASVHRSTEERLQGREGKSPLWRGQAPNYQERLGSCTLNRDAPLTLGYSCPPFLLLSVQLIQREEDFFQRWCEGFKRRPVQGNPARPAPACQWIGALWGLIVTRGLAESGAGTHMPIAGDGGGFDLSSFCPSVFMQALPPHTLNPAQRQETITSRSPASSRLAARGPLQLECRHLPAGRETRRGALTKEGRRWKGKSHTGEGSETLENRPFVGFDTGCGGGGLVWFFHLYCLKPPAQLAAPSAPCCRCVQGEGGQVGLQSWRPGHSDPAALFARAPRRAGAPSSCRKATIAPRWVP